MKYYTTNFAAAYGACNYGEQSFDNQSATCEDGSSAAGTSAGGASGGTDGGMLSNTGFDIVLVASIACVIVFVALVVKFARKPKTAKASSEN